MASKTYETFLSSIHQYRVYCCSNCGFLYIHYPKAIYFTPRQTALKTSIFALGTNQQIQKGTRYKFYLPCSQSAPKAADRVGSLSPPFLLKCKVLNIKINFRDAKLFKIPKLLITKTKEEDMTRATVKHISEKLN